MPNSPRTPAQGQGHWSPYLAGALAGLLVIASAALTENYPGASTTFVRTAGMLEELIGAERVAAMPYFNRFLPVIDWQWMFVAGIFIGSLAAALLSGTFKLQAVPDMWAERFGPAKGPRFLAALAGGFLAMFGARLADGCPSGHGLSGSLQLALSGLVALVFFFLGGLPVAWLLYRKGGRP